MPINFSKKPTIFIDLDGTLVVHNYHPLITKDIFLQGAIEKLKELKNLGYFIVLTTNRSFDECSQVIEKLHENFFEFDACLFDLTTGYRLLINDNKPDKSVKTISIPVIRNIGIGDVAFSYGDY